MKNFIFKSTDADLQKMFHLLDTILADVLYVSHRTDFLIKEFKKLTTDKDLQTQVDKYFDEGEAHLGHENDTKHIPEEEI